MIVKIIMMMIIIILVMIIKYCMNHNACEAKRELGFTSINVNQRIYSLGQ